MKKQRYNENLLTEKQKRIIDQGSHVTITAGIGANARELRIYKENGVYYAEET